jgi:hypothetical protein
MINYKFLDKSIKFYYKKDYNRIEAPWLVSKYINDLTKPVDGSDWLLNGFDKYLVASGEQSFLYLAIKEILLKGKYQTITPCFRKDEIDYIHNHYFMKNELIHVLKKPLDDMNKIHYQINDLILDSLLFFNSIGFTNLKIEKINDYQFDIITNNGNELGSYGYRSFPFISYIYGTGIAEPRTSKLLKIQ